MGHSVISPDPDVKSGGYAKEGGPDIPDCPRFYQVRGPMRSAKVVVLG